jgi:predicted dehydrogenase
MGERGIGIGVIGCGHWGPNHIRAFSALPGVRVTWAVDKDRTRRDHVSALYDRVRIGEDAAAVLDDAATDAVVIATPAVTHRDLALAALRAGKHVLCEKPLCLTSAECATLIAAAQHRVLMVGHVFLFNAGILKLRELVTSDRFGRTYYASAVRTNLGPIRDDVNVSFDLAAHEISIFNFLFDAPPLTVSACGRAYLRPGVEDVVFVTLTYPSDVTAGITASWLSPKKVREITLVSEHQMAVWSDVTTNPIAIYDKGVIREPYYDSYGEFQLLTRDGDVTIPKLPLEEPLKRQAQAFIAAIEHGDAGICSGERGWEVVRTLEAIEASMRRGGAEIAVEPYAALPIGARA